MERAVRRRRATRGSIVFGLLLAAAIAFAVPMQAGGSSGSKTASARIARELRSMKDTLHTSAFWTNAAAHAKSDRGPRPRHFRAFSLDGAQMRSTLAKAPHERTSAATTHPLVISLPAPGGGFQRFAVQESPIMEPALAAQHPDIKTFSGRGIDDLAATIRLDEGPLGVHASVRSPNGDWYIDPVNTADASSSYESYYGSDLGDDTHGVFVERDGDDAAVEAQAADLSTNGGGPSVGTQLRTYRLALVSDQTYANWFHASDNPANVTAAKVALMNRVDQIYEDETSIRMVLIGNNDLLNLNTDADAILPNGPCGSAACFTSAQLASCGSSTLSRNRIVVGQIIGASNYDIGHIAVGQNGGGIASLGVVGGNSKAQGCTGIPQPDGDYYAVDYVAHEMGHEFGGNHTFNGTQLNCSGGNRNAGTSVEPGSGSSIMAYAGICRQDDLQPHSDPYWSQRSFQELTNYTSSSRPAINEVQTASLRDFDGTDSFTLSYGGSKTPPIVNGSNYSAAGIQAALQGVSEVQTVALTGYDTNGDSYTLRYNGADSAPIVRGQNNTAAGIQNALQGGNEQQQVSLAGFSGTTQSFQVQIGGNNSAVLGSGGLAITNANVAAAINAISGFAGTVSASGSGNTGFTLTFAGASAGVDVPSVSIVNCTGACTSTVRETAKGGAPIAGWPTGATVSASSPTDSGYTLTFGGALTGVDVAPLDVTNGNGASGAVTETTKGVPGILPAGGLATVAAFGGSGTFNTTGFQVTFGGTLAGQNLDSLQLTDLNGATAWIGETAKGGPIDNNGYTVTPTGNDPPVVQTPVQYTIPYRTPFTLTGAATDPNGDVVTYLWEQNDVGVGAGTALINPAKTTGPLFRQFGTPLDASVYDVHQFHSPGENHVTTDPSRTFPDMAQILANNTNAATGDCPGPPIPPSPASGGTNVPQPQIDCYSEFLPTSVYAGPMHFRLTARDGHPNGGGIASSDTTVNLAPGTGPFLVTSQASGESYAGESTQTVTWNVAGTDAPPIGTTNVKISVSADGGVTFPYVVADAAPNTGSASVVLPNVATSHARIKVEAVGNVFFDVNDADFTIVGVADVTNDAPAGGANVQYSDALSPTVTVTATDPDTAGSALTATAAGLPTGMSLADGTASGAGTLPGTHTWTVSGATQAAPGAYPVTVSVTDDQGHTSTTTFTIDVTPENAATAYTGDPFAFLPSATSTRSVTLRAAVGDAADGSAGDVRNATVSFSEGSTVLCANLAVSLVTGDPAGGSASCDVSLPAGSHTITVTIGGSYSGTATSTVDVLPQQGSQIDVTGTYDSSGSAGQYAADAGTKVLVGGSFASKDRKKPGSDPIGDLEILFTSNGVDYDLKSTATTSVGAECQAKTCHAAVDATATLYRVPAKGKPVVVLTGLQVRVVATDGPSTKTSAYTVWDGDKLAFSTQWNGTRSTERPFLRGGLVSIAL